VKKKSRRTRRKRQDNLCGNEKKEPKGAIGSITGGQQKGELSKSKQWEKKFLAPP